MLPIPILPAQGGRTATEVAMALEAVLDRIEASRDSAIWISTLTRTQAREMLAAAAARRAAGEALPLFGIPFAVKDNIDVVGLPTTAGCPDFAYRPARSAPVVERLVAAGAIPVGKANLDQFATGLNGTRTPYGIPASVFGTGRVSGGSSSGSAIAVAAGLVPFALGTDTAGSGRVPAAFNNLVGLKPTRGLLSPRGMVPACRSLDCVSIFANTVEDAMAVARVAAGYDSDEPYSRAAPPGVLAPIPVPVGFRFGVPDADALAACDAGVLPLFEAAAARLEALGGVPVPVDLDPFREAATLLYAGPWVAERLAAIRDFVQARPESLHPVVADIILSGARYSAADTFEAQHRLALLRRRAEAEWACMDVLLLPTAPCVAPTVAAMLADPVGLNARLGTYTNFVNLMDLSALAVPAGIDANGLPFGITLVGAAFDEARLAAIGGALHRALPGATLGGSDLPLDALLPHPAAA